MEFLYTLLVLLLVTRLLAEAAVRLGQPALIGELIGGIALGLVVGSSTETFPILSQITEDRGFVAITDLGIFFLMLLGGVELRPREIAETSASSLAVAAGGMLVPLGVGFGLAWAFLPESPVRTAQCLFVGTALSITAVPVAIRVLMDIGKLDTPGGRLVVSAAIVDDVLGLFLLAVLTSVVQSGEMPGAAGLAVLAGQIVVFFLITGVLGWFLMPRLGRLIRRFQTSEIEFSMLLLTALAFAFVAELLHMHFILGAFLAGLYFGHQTMGKEVFEDVKRKVSAMTSGFLAPIFFASIGLHLQLEAVTGIPLFLTLLLVAAFLTKLVGAGLPAYWLGLSKRDATGIGFAMSARGTVELVIADIALRAGLFNSPQPTPDVVANLFSAIVIMAVVTTLAAPVGLRLLFRHETDSQKKV